jgi:hypothetical protein
MSHFFSVFWYTLQELSINQKKAAVVLNHVHFLFPSSSTSDNSILYSASVLVYNEKMATN